MVDRIKHYLLTAGASIHDEEALTALELQGRTMGKVNEVINLCNELEQDLTRAIEGLPDVVDNALGEMYEDGTLTKILNTQVLNNSLATIRGEIESLRTILATIEAEQIVDTSSNMELIDARVNKSGVSHRTVGEHIRSLEDGSGFIDAIRPGTVNAGRIMPGMLGGDLKNIAKRKNLLMAGHWNGEPGYYDKDSKEFIGHTGYKQSDKFPCAYGDMFHLISYVYGPLVCPAVVFDANGNVLDVLGNPGDGTWNPDEGVIAVKNGAAAYISFICGSGYVAEFRASRYTLKSGVKLSHKNGLGFWRMRAKKRTDTITDRAQIKCWFPLPVNRQEDTEYTIKLNFIKTQNLKNYTLRLFAATSDSSYDESISYSAPTYLMSPVIDLEAICKVPVSTTGDLPVTHLCMFIDFIPISEDSYMDIELYKPLLNDAISAINPTLHGALDTDMFMDVRPGAELFSTFDKTIVGLGDSLMSGNTLSKDKSWFNRACGALNMRYYNAGVNGSSIAGAPTATSPMITRVASVLAGRKPDYFILQGGANDKRINVPLDNFKNAIRSIIGTVQSIAPDCKILLATNWRRTENANAIGLYDSDYVAAMIEVAEEYCLPVVNNYADSGINLLNPAQSAWADQGMVTTGTPDIHFSVAGHKFVAERYISEIAKL